VLPAGLAVAEPQAPQALPQAPVAQALPQGLLHGAQWLAHWIGAAVQQVAAGAQVEQAAVWQGAQLGAVKVAVWHGAHADRAAQWLTWWQCERRAQHSSSSSSARTCGARTASMAANIEAVISRCNMVSLLRG